MTIKVVESIKNYKINHVKFKFFHEQKKIIIYIYNKMNKSKMPNQ